MPPARIPDHEAARLLALKSYDILDTEPEASFDTIVEVAARLTGVPIALVSLVDESRQWVKARHGIALTVTPRDQAFCAHAILDPAHPTVINDTAADARVRDNPLVTGEAGFRFYAGVPLVGADGHALGTLCVLDRRPRTMPPDLLDSLRGLARTVSEMLELRRVSLELRDTLHQRERLEARLRQAQKLEAVGRLTGGIAHEFNNLFQIILGNVEQMAESPYADRDAAEGTIAAVMRGAGLTHQLLAFSRSQPLRPDILPLAPLAERAARQSLDRGIVVDLDIACPDQTVFADAGELAACLDSLVTNARDAVLGGGAIRLGVARETVVATASPGTSPGPARLANGGYGVLWVEDDGGGMAPEVLDRAFDPFFSTKEEGRGAGLGLAMVLGFVWQSGGDVRIASRPGGGTRVDILLPEPASLAAE